MVRRGGQREREGERTWKRAVETEGSRERGRGKWKVREKARERADRARGASDHNHKGCIFPEKKQKNWIKANVNYA